MVHYLALFFCASLLHAQGLLPSLRNIVWQRALRQQGLELVVLRPVLLGLIALEEVCIVLLLLLLLHILLVHLLQLLVLLPPDPPATLLPSHELLASSLAVRFLHWQQAFSKSLPLALALACSFLGVFPLGLFAFGLLDFGVFALEAGLCFTGVLGSSTTPSSFSSGVTWPMGISSSATPMPTSYCTYLSNLSKLFEINLAAKVNNNQ